MDILYSIVYSGQSFAKTSSERRGVILSNAISVSVSVLGTILAILYYIWYGWNVVTILIFCISVLTSSAILFNRSGFIYVSRVWVSLIIPVFLTALSIYSKSLYYQSREELDYFTFRFVIMCSCVFPWVLFSMREKKALWTCSLVGLLILMCHDPLHDLFHVGFAKETLDPASYFFTNIVIFMSCVVLISALAFLKRISEQSEYRNASLIVKLHEANHSLTEKNTEIEAQAAELQAQSEIMEMNQKQLMDAYLVIHDQKTKLVSQNETLAAELINKNIDLTETNSELIKHNNELRQFSYTVSHNLRGPVASLMGLIELLNPTNFKNDDLEVVTHIRSSSYQLDAIIKDLTKIIDIRHDIFKIRQKLLLRHEIAEVTKILQKDITFHQVDIVRNLHANQLYSVRPMVHSILYNLLNNAIKYRSPERKPVITIHSQQSENYNILEIADNGLGIDLKQNGENLFKLYKRFHFHTEGKGLGLYLVKLQVEALGGYITVDSEINRFTRFTIYLRKPENVNRQILLEEPHVEIFYDAHINAIGILWKGAITSEQYRSAFSKCLEFTKIYNTPNYLADMSLQGHIAVEDQQWLFKKIIPDAARNGLLRIATAHRNVSDEHVRNYLNSIHDTLAALGIQHVFFPSIQDAFDWLESENEKITLKLRNDGAGH